MLAMHAILASTLLAYASGNVRDAVQEGCRLAHTLKTSLTDLSVSLPKKQFDQMESMYAPKMDCSTDPHNAVMGYNLKGATWAECQSADAKVYEANAVRLFSAKCIQEIIDEDDKTAAVWLEVGASSNLESEFKYRAAIRLSFDADDKIASQHIVFDTYQFLKQPKGMVTTLAEISPSSTVATFGAIGMLCAVVLFIVSFRGQRNQITSRPLLGDEA